MSKKSVKEKGRSSTAIRTEGEAQITTQILKIY